MRTMFSPLQIAGMEVKNRTFMAPMSLGYESQDGTINEKMEAYWLRRAQGGVGCIIVDATGCIIVDATSVDPNVPYLGNTLCFRSEESIQKYKSFTDKVHEYGCKISPQITHPGPESVSAFYGVAPLASSVYPNSMGQMTREVALEEIPGIIDVYVKASLDAKRAGFDGIELHCAHALGNTLCFRSEESIQKYKSFTDKVHEYGCKIIPQITHPGPESVSAFYGVAPLASSVYPNSMGQMTREVALEEIPGIIDLYVKASLDAKRAGFDGIELHCAHAYMLLGSFLSPLRNKRTDAYGGSLLNRARLLFEVIDGIKAACGKDFSIVLRMSGSERDPQGNTLEDMKRLIPYLEQHGVDCFEISGGTQYERCNKIIPCHGEAEFANLQEAKAIKAVATKPVITVGKILDAKLAEDVLDAGEVIPCHGEAEFANLQEAKAIKAVATKPVITVGKILDAKLAEDVLDAGEVDGVVIGRALLADPDFVNKAQEERYDEIAPCAACGIGCVGEQTKRRPATCVINPTAGRELEFECTPTKDAKDIVVVGAGIGGLAAARILAKRGHRVIVLEKENKAGERYDEIAPCAACGIGCVGEQTKRRPATCVINPTAGRELEFESTPTKDAKDIVVVGAGIGGLAAARILAKRGHRVIVLEKENKAGGQINDRSI